ncbi:hypothetical protein PMAYCL1PPCAC_10958, partial [Pristionchus mayeri]
CIVPEMDMIDLPCPLSAPSCEMPYRIFESTSSGISAKLRCRFSGRLFDIDGSEIGDDIVCNSTTGGWVRPSSGKRIEGALCAGV